MDLNKIKLPKVNERLDLAKRMSDSLELKIIESIQELEFLKNYKFETYEIDSVLSRLIKRHQDDYIRFRFKSTDDE